MLNEAQLIGRLGSDPDIRYLSDSTTVANFTLATSEKWTDKRSGEQKEATEWHRISAFGSLADIIRQYVRKGSLVFVRGSLHTREYEKDGIKRYSTEIRAHTLKMLGGNPANGSTSEPQSTPQTGEDDLPF